MIIGCTGHRPDKLGGYKLPNPTYIHVCQEIEKALKEFKPDKCISGMCIGVDQWFANICVKLGISFIAAVPFVKQEVMWPEKSRIIYQKLLAKANEVVIVSEGEYSAAKMQIRNEWMVDRCDLLLAIWNGTKGGTANCIDYAKKIGREIRYIAP